MIYNKVSFGRLVLMLFSMVIFSASCKKLSEKPISFVEPTDFYTSPSQIEAVFAASMNGLWNTWSGGYGYGFLNFIHDDQYFGGDLVIPNNHAADLWQLHYSAILNINSAIRAVDAGNLGASTTQGQLDELMGQAKFLRAFNYFMLVRMFGPLPLISENTPDPVNNKLSRSPIADVYSLIVADFTEASQKLPRKWSDDKKGRPTSGSAKGLLAKAYLTMATAPLNETSNYSKAADYAKQVMDEGDYHLVKDISKVFSMNTKYGPEAMWSFNSNYADMSIDAQIYWPPFKGGWGDIKVQPEWEKKYPSSPRKDAYLLYKIDGVRYEDWPSDKYPFVKKFMYDDEGDFNNYKAVMSFPIIRYADILLIYAEAANMANGSPTQEAVDAINLVIDRANGYLPNIGHPFLTLSMSKQSFDDAVIEERNQELCFEYDRWFDLVRKRILKQKSIPQIQQNFSDDDYLFPIPDNDILINPELGQNPGYK
ncbi:MAG: RagB/SusD family nutrient uptake outer membrane protein [Ginsengibacter sp.]